METNEKIKNLISENDVCLFMKGTPDSPQCGFSMAVSNVLKHLKVNFKGINVSVTPFLGYVRYNEKAKAYGINDLPDDFGPGAGFLPEFDGVLVLQNEIFWAGQRFGTEIEWGVNPKTNFLANIAYVENMRLRNEDSHMLRQDVLGPAPNVISTGEGRGWMIDLMGNYSYNNNLGFEIGYRFWRFEDRDAVNTNHAIFPLTFPIRQLYSQRQGFMIGAEYTF